MSKTSSSLRFLHVIGYAIIGIFTGIILGFLFGHFIGSILVFTSDGRVGTEMPDVAHFFGMGAGSVIGAIFGSLVGYKEE